MEYHSNGSPRVARTGLLQIGVIERGVPQECVFGRASGATVRLGHVLRVFSIRLWKQGIVVRIQTGLDTPRVRINVRLRCVWKWFPRGTSLRGTPLTIVSSTEKSWRTPWTRPEPSKRFPLRTSCEANVLKKT